MSDLSPIQSDDHVILAQVADTHWVLQGENHLNALLTGQGAYPTPVRSVIFESAAALDVFLQTQDVQLGSLWSVHPAIINRLKSNDELVEITPPSVG